MKRLVAVLLVVSLPTVGALSPGPPGPGVSFGDGVPDDVRILARETWGRFIGVFSAHGHCLGRVTVAGAWQLDDRARYEPDEGVAVIRLPGTAPNLSATLVHEFAHHLEASCPRHEELRPAFLDAQGFPPGASWFDGSTWETTPSEQFAEATVEVVLGRRPSHARVHIMPEAMEVIRSWARGR